MKTLIVSLLLVACNNVEDQTLLAQNRGIPVPPPPAELLFEHEGCKVYKFYDGSPLLPAHYFAHCQGPSTTTSSQSKGKQEEISTSVSK
jgi:hypothetical protein